MIVILNSSTFFRKQDKHFSCARGNHATVFISAQYAALCGFLADAAWIEEADLKVMGCFHNDIKDICLLENVQAINNYKVNAFRSAIKIADMLELEPVSNFFEELKENEDEICLMLGRLTRHELHDRSASRPEAGVGYFSADQ